MRFHQVLAFLETEQLVEIAPIAEANGFDGLYVSDHLLYPRDLRSPYPRSPYETGQPIWSPETPWPDPWCLISAMAAVTKTIKFTTGVYVAPARDLMTVTKLVGTAAVLSRDRVVLGVGAGWCEEEFNITGQPFHDRGKRLDDMIPALRSLLRPGWVEYHGSHFDVAPVQISPAPQEPVPIVVGGYSAAAVRRATELGDGWVFSVGGLLPPEQSLAEIARVRQARRNTGRAESPFTIYSSAPQHTPDLIRRFEDAGVTDWVSLSWQVAEQRSDRSFQSSLRHKIEAVERYAEQVIAKIKP